MKALSVLGSTGSIGTQTLEIVEDFPDRFRVVALTAGNNLDLLISQIQRHAPEVVALADAERVAELRDRLNAPATNLTQDLYVQDGLKTGRVMVKDEDVCLHCGLCAERCPTGAWDMQKYLIDITQAGPKCRTR